MNSRSLLCLGALATLLAACAPVSTSKSDTVPSAGAEKALPYTIIGMEEYQNFLGSWDEDAQPALFAQIRTPAQYRTLFHSAAVMGGNKPFGPEDSLFKTEQILVVGRIVGDLDKVFLVESAVAKDGVLTLSYRFKPSAEGSPATFKAALEVRVPQGDYRKVVFVENGKPVGELDAAGGQWVLPMSAAKAEQ
jgi:hypothetical protein